MTWLKFEYLVTRFEFRQLRLLVHRLVPGEAFALSNVRIVGNPEHSMPTGGAFQPARACAIMLIGCRWS